MLLDKLGQQTAIRIIDEAGSEKKGKKNVTADGLKVNFVGRFRIS